MRPSELETKTLNEEYEGKPIQLHKFLDRGGNTRFPKVLRNAFYLLWNEVDWKGRHCTRFIIKGPRGGGKTKLIGAIGFSKWYQQNRKIINMGGSLVQAEIGYGYFMGHVNSSASIVQELPAPPSQTRTRKEDGTYYRAVAASPKSVRGPHPDGLIIDETVEAKDQLVLDAMPMIDSSRNPFIIMTSTFHKIFGIFQETWDFADKKGWCRISWDILDVCAPFDFDTYKNNPELLAEIPDLTIEQAGENSLEFRVQGKTGDPEGWVMFDNVIHAWREKRTIDWFDVEYMGSRPSSAGLINDPEDVDACIVKELKPYMEAWKPEADTSAGLDWGFFGQTAWNVGMRWHDNKVVVMNSKEWTMVKDEKIIADIVKDVIKLRVKVIYADASHPFQNHSLRVKLKEELLNHDFSCSVVETHFQLNKLHDDKKSGEIAMLGNYRGYWQKRMIILPATFKEAVWQHKRYRFKEGSDTPLKENDHHPDSMMMMLRKWPIGKVQSILPKENATATKESITDVVNDREAHRKRLETLKRNMILGE